MLILLDYYAYDENLEDTSSFSSGLADVVAKELRNLSREHDRLLRSPQESLSKLEREIVNLDMTKLSIRLCAMDDRRIGLLVE